MSSDQDLGRAQELVDEFRRRIASTAADDLNCSTLEVEAQSICNALGRVLMSEVFMRADAHSPTVEIDGQQWGNRRSSCGTYTTIFGDIEVERSIYQRVGRGRVGVPLELRLGLFEKRYTPQMARIIGHSVAVMTAEDAAGFLEQVGTAQVSSSTLHRITCALAANYESRREEIDTEVRQADLVPVGAVALQVALDGVMVPQDGEHAKPRGRPTTEPCPPRYQARYELSQIIGPAMTDDGTGRMWHEASVGTVSFFDEKGFVLKTTYLGRMPESGKGTLVDELYGEVMTALDERPDLTVCMASDGAPLHWSILSDMAVQLPEEATGEVHFIVDFYHVAKRLVHAADVIAGAGTPEARLMRSNWCETLKLFDDGAKRVLKSMRYHRDQLPRAADQEAVEEDINYLANQMKDGRTGYAAALASNLPIGTGITEAAAKTVVGVRMKRAGARYSQHGGQTVMLFRTALLSGRYPLLFQSLQNTYSADIAEAA